MTRPDESENDAPKSEAPSELKKTVDEVIAEIHEFRKGKRLDGLTIRELIDEGRR